MSEMEAEADRLSSVLVSRRVGLVTELASQLRGPEEPVPPYLYTATLAHFDFRQAPRRNRLNAGKGRSTAEARLSALGEAVERYSAYHWDPQRMWTGAGAVVIAAKTHHTRSLANATAISYRAMTKGLDRWHCLPGRSTFTSLI